MVEGLAIIENVSDQEVGRREQRVLRLVLRLSEHTSALMKSEEVVLNELLMALCLVSAFSPCEEAPWGCAWQK